MRYPTDYNAIVGGAPAIDDMQTHVARIGLNAMANRTPESNIPKKNTQMVHQAVLNACDALDGVKDGVIENPDELQVRSESPRVQRRRRLVVSHRPAGRDDAPAVLAGEAWELGHPCPAFSSLAPSWDWRRSPAHDPLELAVETMKYVVAKDPSWDISRFNPAKDYDLAMLADSDKVLSLTDPNLKPFFDRGGKLLMYHGWQDPQVPAQSTSDISTTSLKTAGQKRAPALRFSCT